MHFFGDAMTDYLAANECNVPFVGLDSNKNVNFPYGTKIKTLKFKKSN